MITQTTEINKVQEKRLDAQEVRALFRELILEVAKDLQEESIYSMPFADADIEIAVAETKEDIATSIKNTVKRLGG